MSNLPAIATDGDVTPFDALHNDMMRAFVREYCTGEQSGRRLNLTHAARIAGYSAPTQDGARLRARADVRAAINWFLDQISLTPQEIIGKLEDWAGADLGAIVDTSNGTSVRLNIKELERLKPFVKSLTFDSNGNPKVEFFDPHAAIRDLMKARGMTKEGIELSGPGGGAIPVSLNVNFVAPHLKNRREVEDQPLLEDGEDE